MSPLNAVDLADRISRRRVVGTTLATLAFLLIQVAARPVFRDDGWGASGWRAYAWAFNAALLLFLLLPAGGLVWGARVRALVNDEVARANSRAAMAAGFWLALLIAFVVYVVPASRPLSAREAVYLIVTPTTGFAVLAFAWLESRAHRDG